MAMTGGTAYLVKSEKTNYGSNSWTTDLYIYVKLISQNVVANTSTIALGMYVYSKYDIAWSDFGTNGTSYIGTATSGSNCFTFTSGKNGSGTKWLIENKRITVSHKSDGTLKLPIYWHWGVNSPWGQYEGPKGSYSVSLRTIDRTAPVVSASVSNITANGFKISASSSVTASKWWYSLNGGTSWTEFGSEGTYKEIAVTGLTPNTTYSVQVRARKKTNAVDGKSSKISCKTLGGTVLRSVETAIVADSEVVSIPLKLTVYDSAFYHKLSIKKNGSTVLTTAAFKLSKSGAIDYSLSLTSSERTTLLSAMATVKSFTGTLSLSTYKESSCTTQIGNASTANVKITTTESVSKPAFTDFSYYDERELVKGITENQSDRTIMIQSYSKLIVVAQAGTAKNGATIKSYSASIGNVSKTGNQPTIDVGGINVYGDSVALTVSCIDSRGYSTSVTKLVKVLKYDRPKLNSITVRRKDEIEDIIQLSFRGSFSSLKPDGSTEINNLKFAGFYYKKTNETEWSEWCSVINDVAVSATTFSYSEDQLMLSTTVPLSLDTESSYDFHLTIRDKLDSYSSYDDYSVIAQGKPLMSLRKRNSSYGYARVGINNPNPEEALDVSGNIGMNGVRVLGYAGTVSGYFSNYKKGGVYLYDAATASNDAPANSSGVLEVLSDSKYVVQRFTTLTSEGDVYVRAYLPSASSGSWTSWAKKAGCGSAKFDGVVTDSLTVNKEVEIYGSTPHIDFHFNNSANDYTTRIIETASGKLNISALNGVQINGTTIDMSKLATESVTLSVVSGRLTDLSYTAKYSPLLNAVFVRIYGKIAADLSTGYDYDVLNIGSRSPNYVAALSTKTGKLITACAKSVGVISLRPMTDNITASAGWGIYITGFWFV